MNYTALQQQFYFGEISPRYQGATTSTIYAQGLRKFENGYISPTGAVYKRTGTERLQASVDSGANVLLFPFYAFNRNYIVVLAQGLIILYNTLYNFDKLPNYIVEDEDLINYADEDIPAISVECINNKAYLIHKKYKPRVLTIDGGSSHLFGFDTGNTYTIETLDVGSVALTEVSIYENLTISDIEFSGDIDFAAGDDYYPNIQCFKSGRWFLAGNIASPSTIYASRASDAEGKSRFSDFTLSDKYFKITTFTTVNVRIGSNTGTIEQTSYSSSYIVRVREDGDTEHTDDATTTYETFQNVDNQTRYRETITWKEYKFTEEVFDSHAIELSESDAMGSAISFIVPATRLLFGMKSTIWMDTGAGITPANFDLIKATSVTNSAVRPVQYGAYIFFVKGNGRGVIAMQYSDEASGFGCIDISDSASHLFTSKIKQLALVEHEVPTLFCLLEDGTLLSCTINLNAGYGWSTVKLGDGGKVLSICSLHDDVEDWLYMSVDSGVKTTLRRLQVAEPGSIGNYLDDYELSTNHNAATFTFPFHEEGDEVDIVADGIYQGTYTLNENKAVTLEELHQDVYCGRSFTFRMITLNPELPSNSATSMGKKRQVVKQKAYVINTRDFDAGFNTSSTMQNDRYGKTLYGYLDSPFTGYQKMDVLSRVTDDIKEEITSELPYPFCMQSLLTEFTILEA